MKTTTFVLWLRVENNSKFVRGQTRARHAIEDHHLSRHGMKKLGAWEYELTFTCEDDAELDRQVHDLLQAIDHEAALSHCFVEFDLRQKGTDRSG